MLNPELIFKSFDYSLYEWYDPFGFYVGIYNNSHLLFTHDVWKRYDKLTITDIRHIPTKNEMDYIFKFHPELTNVYHKSDDMYNLKDLITLDHIYYRRAKNRLLHILQSDRYSILSVNRIYG